MTVFNDSNTSISTMPRLDKRLKAVAKQVHCSGHADIGSDHGHLLKALLASGRIEYGIAIENKRLPWENSVATLRGMNADVRLANGLEGLAVGEVDSLSICGVGGKTMRRILVAHPDRIPPRIVLQPNRHPEIVRRWAMDAGFHLIHEEMTGGRRHFTVLRYERSDSPDDPAYRGGDVAAALLFGPMIMERREPSFLRWLASERSYLRTLKQLNVDARHRLTVIDRVLGDAQTMIDD